MNYLNQLVTLLSKLAKLSDKLVPLILSMAVLAALLIIAKH